MQKLFEIFKTGESSYLLKDAEGEEIPLIMGRCTLETDHLIPRISLSLKGIIPQEVLK